MIETEPHNPGAPALIDTVAEIDAFLKDDSPNAYEKVVDRLLASPRYGERMAGEWLDVARFADTHPVRLHLPGHGGDTAGATVLSASSESAAAGRSTARPAPTWTGRRSLTSR